MRPYRGFRNPFRSFTVAFKGSKLFIKRKFQFRYVARKNLAAFDLLLYIEQITLISSSTFFEIREYISKSCEKANILHQNYSFLNIKALCWKRSRITVQFSQLAHKRKNIGFKAYFDAFLILGWPSFGGMVNISTFSFKVYAPRPFCTCNVNTAQCELDKKSKFSKILEYFQVLYLF